MKTMTNAQLPSQEEIEAVGKLPIEQQLQLAVSNFGGSMEARLAGAAIATVVARMVQLTDEDQKDLFECVQDLGTIKGPEDASETMKTILEILEPTCKGTDPVSADELLADIPEEQEAREKHESWLVWISEKLRALRTERGLTQEKLAELSGLPQSHISRLEGGKHSPSNQTLAKIASAMGVDPRELSLEI